MMCRRWGDLRMKFARPAPLPPQRGPTCYFQPPLWWLWWGWPQQPFRTGKARLPRPWRLRFFYVFPQSRPMP